MSKGDLTPPIPKGELLTWDMDRGATRTILTFAPATTTVEGCQWITDTTSLIVSTLVQEPNQEKLQRVLLLDANSGSSVVVNESKLPSKFLINVSPTKPLVSISRTWWNGSHNEVQMFLMDISGHLSKPSHLIETDPAIGMSTSGFDKQGDGPFVFVFGSDGEKAFRFVEGGEMVPASTIIQMPVTGDQENIPKGISLESSAVSTSLEPVDKKALWLVVGEKGTHRVLVTVDGASGQIAPYGTGVSYCQDGWLAVRRIAQIPIEVYEKQVSTEQQEAAIAMCQRGADLLKQLQGQSDRIPERSLWSEYLQRSHLSAELSSFGYTYSGEEITARNRKTIEIGRCDTKTGTAILNADWSIRWIPANGGLRSETAPP